MSCPLRIFKLSGQWHTLGSHGSLVESLEAMENNAKEGSVSTKAVVGAEKQRLEFVVTAAARRAAELRRMLETGETIVRSI